MSASKRIVISQSATRKQIRSMGGCAYTEQVVYLTPNGTRTNGKPAFHSETRHEISQRKK